MKRLKANADKMLWITYITVFERMAAYCLHDKETCASRHSSVESERRDAGFENKKSFQKKCQSISRLFLFLKNHLIYRQIEIACNCKSIRKVSGKYHPSVSRMYQDNPFETLPRTQCADYVPEKASRNRGFGMCTTPWAQDARGVGKACPKSAHWFGQWKNRGDFTITTSAGLCSAFSSLILSDISLILSWHFRMSAKHAIYLYIRHVV